MSMFAHYSKSDEQVRRLFRASELGKRDKATRNDKYLNRTLAVIRRRQAAETPDIDFSQLLAKGMERAHAVESAGVDETDDEDEHLYSPEEAEELEVSSLPDLPVPAGLIKDMADYFFATAIRPVQEIALSAAIALAAGVCGRAYNISESGLNQYIILLAKTGRGKEGAASGINKLITAVRPQLPLVDTVLGPASFASGQALVKALSEQHCFVSVLGEFGLTLQQISDQRANTTQISLRKELLDLFSKSGWKQSLRASVYADATKNTKAVRAPCVSIFGESTPETFFEGLEASHIAEGLIPRFSIIEYVGERPERNRNAGIEPSKRLCDEFSELVAASMTAARNNACTQVEMSDEALELLDSFDAKVDVLINSTKVDVELQLWNRAHLKALKFAALFAVARSPHEPVVDLEMAQYAIAFVESEVRRVAARFQSGDVGRGDHKQAADLKATILAYRKLDATKRASYRIPDDVFNAGYITHNFLSKRTTGLASFRQDRSGATVSLKKMIASFIDSGLLVQIPKPKLEKQFGFLGIAYGVNITALKGA